MKKRNIIFIFALIIIGASLILTNSCKKEDDTESPLQLIVDTLLTNLEYPTGLWIKGNNIYLTETAARNTSFGGKLCLNKFDLTNNQKTILLNNPMCSDAVVVTNDGKIYLTSYFDSYPGNSGKVSVYDPVLNIETFLFNLEMASTDMFLNDNNDILIIGCNIQPDSKSIYKLPSGNYSNPVVLKTGLGCQSCITQIGDIIYFGASEIKYFGGDGVLQAFKNKSVHSISSSQQYLYYADVYNNFIGRIDLSTKQNDTLLSNLNAPISVRFDQSTNKLYFLESGTGAGKYKDGTLKVLSLNP